MSQDLRPSNVGGKPLDRKTNMSQHNINKPPVPPSAPAYHSPPHHHPSQTNTSQQSSQIVAQTWNNPYDPQTLDLMSYSAPHPASPLSKHLNKLLPPNESIINFFNTLFQESGEKIANELITNAKIIFGSILKSVQDLLSSRK